MAPMSTPRPAEDAPLGDSSLQTTLLGRLQDQDDEAWRRLDHLYGPVLFGWCRGAGLRPDDAADVRQEVFRSLAAHIGCFRREQPSDSFRGWLWRITQNKLRDFFRRDAKQPHAAGGTSHQERLHEVALEPDDGTEPPSSADEVAGVFRRALELVQAEFEARTWQAFWLVAIDGRPPAEAAAELGMSAGAVYVAKSRVLKRFREEFGDLLAEGD